MRVSLFVTCLGDRFFAQAAADAVRLLRSLGVEVDFPSGQTCCGQPAWNAGHVEPARRMARHTRHVFRGGAYVVLPSGSCTAMLRSVYPDLLGEGDPAGRVGEAPEPAGDDGALEPAGADGASAEVGRDHVSEPVGTGHVAAAVGPDDGPLHLRARELAEFVVDVLGVTELGRGLEGRRLAYHHGCHALRELGQREAPLALLGAAGAEVVEWEAAEECCGFGGLFAVKAAPVSVAMADRKLDTLPAVDALVSADPGCLLHLGSRAARRGVGPPVLPLASALWEARRGAGPGGPGRPDGAGREARGAGSEGGTDGRA